MTKALYDKIQEKQFRIIAPFLCFLGDLSICRYLYLKMTSEETFSTIMRGIKLSVKMNPNLQEVTIPPNFHNEMYQLLVQTLLLMFVIIVGFHTINYLIYSMKKAYWSYVYIKIMAWVAAPSVFLLALESFDEFPGLASYLLLQTAFYFFVAFGFKYFKIQKTLGRQSGSAPASSN